MKYAIICVGYNRPDSMKVLLDSVSRAEYGSYYVDLIVSIDRGKRHKEVAEVAQDAEWNHGKKIIHEQPERIGLKKHILLCGDYSASYDAIVVLEDDLIVSPHFFEYVVQTVAKYGNDTRISGISLYKHLFHPGARRLFEPDNNGFDVYLMQFAQSWGQCWTNRMWRDFRDWYDANEEISFTDKKCIPENIRAWDDHSWLKYYMLYNVINNKYYIYPYVSLTSNTSSSGQHNAGNNNDYQVPLLHGSLKYRLPEFNEAVSYDVFFERMNIGSKVFPELHGVKLLDLYGIRTDYDNADYLISTRALPYRIVNSVALCQRPIEQNLLSPKQGEGIRIYDLHTADKIIKMDSTLLTRFEVRGIIWRRLMKLAVTEIVQSRSAELSRYLGKLKNKASK